MEALEVFIGKVCPVSREEISLVVDGKELNGNKVPLFDDEKEHYITVKF